MFMQSQPWSMLGPKHEATIVGEQENTGGSNNHQCAHEQKKEGQLALLLWPS